MLYMYESSANDIMGVFVNALVCNEEGRGLDQVLQTDINSQKRKSRAPM